MSSYLQDTVGDTQYTFYRTCQFWFDKFSALRHGVMVLLTIGVEIETQRHENYTENYFIHLALLTSHLGDFLLLLID